MVTSPMLIFTNCCSIDDWFRSQFSPSLTEQFRKIFRNCGARTALRQWGHVFELNERHECVKNCTRIVVGYIHLVGSEFYRIIHSRMQYSWNMWPHCVTSVETSVLKCFQQTEQKILLFSDIVEFVKDVVIEHDTNTHWWHFEWIVVSGCDWRFNSNSVAMGEYCETS